VPKRHFPVILVVSVILKVIAAIVLVISLYSAFMSFQATIKGWEGGQAANMFQQAAPAVTKLSEKLLSLLKTLSDVLGSMFFPLFMWAFAEFIVAIRDIEFNTRVTAGIKEVMAVEDYSAPAIDTKETE